MPYFTIDTEVDISVDEFLYECDSNDIENLIEELIKKGWRVIRVLARSHPPLSTKEIENQLQENLKTYLPFGYNSFLFNRSLSTIYIQKIEVKTIQDIFNTDIYGLLND
jgi:predicted CopG family antitoxin